MTCLPRLLDSVGEFHVLKRVGEVRSSNRLDSTNGVDELFLDSPSTSLIFRYLDHAQAVISAATARNDRIVGESAGCNV